MKFAMSADSGDCASYRPRIDGATITIQFVFKTVARGLEWDNLIWKYMDLIMCASASSNKRAHIWAKSELWHHAVASNSTQEKCIHVIWERVIKSSIFAGLFFGLFMVCIIMWYLCSLFLHIDIDSLLHTNCCQGLKTHIFRQNTFEFILLQ